VKSGLPRHQRYIVKQQGSVVIFYFKSSSQSLKEHTIEALFETVVAILVYASWHPHCTSKWCRRKMRTGIFMPCSPHSLQHKPQRLLSSIIDKGLTSWRESKSKMDAWFTKPYEPSRHEQMFPLEGGVWKEENCYQNIRRG